MTETPQMSTLLYMECIKPGDVSALAILSFLQLPVAALKGESQQLHFVYTPVSAFAAAQYSLLIQHM